MTKLQRLSVAYAAQDNLESELAQRLAELIRSECERIKVEKEAAPQEFQNNC